MTHNAVQSRAAAAIPDGLVKAHDASMACAVAATQVTATTTSTATHAKDGTPASLLKPNVRVCSSRGVQSR